MTTIKTFQDLLEITEKEEEKKGFILDAIREHKASKDYLIAEDAELYYKHQNPTIMRYQKFIHNQFGQKVPDIWSANNKIASNWYNYFTTQAVSFLLGNGVTFESEANKEKLGKEFDKTVQKIATHAKNGAVAFGYWNYDHLECFSLNEFVPLWDEENGALKAGIRFWQIDDDKPLRCTLYELDGKTDYIKRQGEELQVLNKKNSYQQVVKVSEIDGERIFDGGNYPSFPIIPLWNTNKQSDIVGNQGTLDAYDLMISGLINNVSEGEFIYWILKNCGGMDEKDDAKFIEQLKLTHTAHADGDEGASVEAHNVSVEFEATAEALDRLQNQLYHDFMALKVEDISAGEVTATQILAAYEPLNQKTDQFEFQVIEFINALLKLVGIEDAPTFTRSQVSNQGEALEGILQCAEYLDDEYITTKILTLLGDGDKANEVLRRKDAESAKRFEIMRKGDE